MTWFANSENLFFMRMSLWSLGTCKNRLVVGACADPESFVRGGPNLIFFIVDEGIEDPAINGPSSVRQ